MKKEEAGLPLTALVPSLPGNPLEVFDEVSAIRVALVERDAVVLLDEVWDKAGVYLLLDPVQSDGRWGFYVGKAPTGLRARVKQHVAPEKESWSRAILVQRDTTFGFDSTDVGWLEGYLYRRLAASALATPYNKVTPSDDTLAAHEQYKLIQCATGVLRTLRLLGYEPAAPSEPTAVGPGPPARRVSQTKISHLVQSGRLTVGEQLVSLVSIWPATASIGPGGEVVFDGKAYPTPSSAAVVVKGGIETNGWEFWGVLREDGPIPLAAVRAQYDAALHQPQPLAEPTSL